MVSIFASKMYKNCRNQDKIKAAINNPVNNELIQQLSSYVDFVDYDETAPLNPKAERSKSESRDVDKSSSGESKIIPSQHTPIPPRHHIDFPEEEKPAEIPQQNQEPEKKDESEEQKQPQEQAAPETKPAEETKAEGSTSSAVNQSTETKGSKVVGQTALYTGPYILVEDIPDAIDIIKAELNSVDTTCGVNRIIVKDNERELWIYYNDDINLNNVMGAVIERLHNSNHLYLEFNRLARSDNAIVFEITTASTTPELKPVLNSYVFNGKELQKYEVVEKNAKS